MDNMISWNWPNWITVVLMAALGYLLVSFGTQLVFDRLRARGGLRVTGAGDGPSQEQQNFAGIYGASEFAMPGAMTMGL